MTDPIFNDINDPLLKSVLKYKDNPSIKAIEMVFKLKNLFKFVEYVKKREITK